MGVRNVRSRFARVGAGKRSARRRAQRHMDTKYSKKGSRRAKRESPSSPQALLLGSNEGVSPLPPSPAPALPARCPAARGSKGVFARYAQHL
eukprot:3751427-Prymnesium_polylepis.1